MHFKLSLTFLVSLYMISSLHAQPVSIIKDYRNRTYPQYYIFRGESSFKNYDNWQNKINNDISGIIQKYESEEISIDPNNISNIKLFIKDKPNLLNLLHLNAEGRQVQGYPDVTLRFFPGHWVYSKGSKICCDVNSTQTKIKVSDIKPFLKLSYKQEEINQDEQKNVFIIIVPLKKNNERDWYNSEYCRLDSIDESSKILYIKRAQAGSKALNFPNNTYVAPIPATIWGNNIVWYYNLSSTCPKDKNGLMASDVFINEIGDWFKKGSGSLDFLDGIALDVNYFDVSKKGKSWDTDNDGYNDGGWINGNNVWRDGDYSFLRKLRERLGDDKIITCDAHQPSNQQCVGVLNGMESEGLVQHNDAWRGISRTINTHLYWHDNNKREDFRYVVLKYRSGVDLKNIESLSRFAVAMSSCLEAYVTDFFSGYKQPLGHSFMPLPFRKAQSLGKVDGSLLRFAKFSPQHKMCDDNNILKLAKGINCKTEYKNCKLIIEPLESCRDSVMKIHFQGLNLPKGETTYFIKCQSIEPLEGFTNDSLVPRLFWLKPSNLPKIKNKLQNSLLNDIYGLSGVNSENENSFYFRNCFESNNATIDLIVQGRGKFVISDITLYNATDVIGRKFQNAMVLANPSTQGINITFENRQYNIPALDALFIERKK